MSATVAEDITERVKVIAQDVVEEPLFLVDVIVRGRPGSRVVELYVDSATGPSVDELAGVSREVGFLLDTEEELLEGKYRLNVSSPGVDRPLTMPRQFAKNVGRAVRVRRPGPGRKPLTGKLVEADEEGFEIELDNGETKRIAYGEADEVRVLLPW